MNLAWQKDPGAASQNKGLWGSGWREALRGHSAIPSERSESRNLHSARVQIPRLRSG